jgi:hypothetical protein
MSRQSHRRGAGIGCVLGLGLVGLGGLATAPPVVAAPPQPSADQATAARAGCLTRLPIAVTVPSRFTVHYKRVLPVRVTSRVPRIRRLRISLYTFGGDLLGRGTRVSLSGSGVVRLHLRYSLEPGEYTLYSEGEPNRDSSCGPKSRSRVVRFRGCITTLPVSFPNPPGGTAADYGRFLSFQVSSRGPLLRRLRIFVSNSEGRLIGTASRSVLFGTVTVDVLLRRALLPGLYTITVRGSIDSQPRSCGPKHAQQTLTFA